MIIDMILEWLNAMTGMLMNETVFLGIVALICAVVLSFAVYSKYKPENWVFNFSEVERKFRMHKITRLEPRSLHSEKDNKRFIRNASAWNGVINGKAITLWVSKLATAYCFELEDTPEGKAKKIGTLWDGLKGVLGEDLIEGFKQEIKDKLMKSKVFITVELEKGFQDEDLPKMDETDILDDANKNMANLIGSRIKSILHKEDWIRNVGLMGIGATAILLGQQLGII